MKKYYPKIKFTQNKVFDKSIFKMFLSSGRCVKPGLEFLLKNKFKKSRNVIISEYVENIYRYNKKLINESINEMDAEWKKVESYFYKTVGKIFKNYPWPKGNYRGYITIWHIFPRDIKNKTFSYPIKSLKYHNLKIANRIVAHEMLHFIAYDYLQKVYKLKPSEVYHKNNKFWQFTENLNVLIENEKYWKKFTQELGSKPYISCREQYKKMKKIWDKNKDLDNLIEKIFKVKRHDK